MDSQQSIRDQLVTKATEDNEFRARLIADPSAAIEEAFDIKLPDNLSLHIHEDGIDSAHIVLPPSSELTDESLEAAAGGFCNGWRD